MKILLLLLMALNPLSLRAQWIAADFPPQGVQALAVQGSTMFSCYPSLTNTLYRSTDTGRTWVDSHTGILGAGAISLYADDSIVLAGTYKYGIFRSSDCGNNWQQTDSTWKYALISCLASHNGYLFAGGQQQSTFSVVLRSSDAGQHWKYINVPELNGQVNSIVSIDSLLFVASAQSPIAVSTNDGDSWHYLSNGPLGAMFLFVSDSFLYASPYNETLLLRSGDRGSHWTQLHGAFDGMEYPGAMVRDSTNLYLCAWDGIRYGHGDVFLSRNHGDTWVSVSANLTKVDIISEIIFGGYLFVGLDNDRALYRRSLADIQQHASVSAVPNRAIKLQSFPNPFTTSIELSYTIPRRATVFLEVFDELGRSIRKVEYGMMDSGEHEIHIDGADFVGRFYNAVLRVGDERFTHQLLRGQ